MKGFLTGIVLLFFLALNSPLKAATTLLVYPNPFCNRATINFKLTANDTITLRVFDLTGKIVRSYLDSVALPPGSYDINCEGDSLPDGIYLVKLANKDSGIAAKLVKTGGCNPTSINKSVLQTVLLFPNPTTDLLTVSIEGYKTIIISDMKGRVCQTIKTEEQKISVANLPVDVYLVRVINKENQLMAAQRIIKEE